MYTLQFRYKYEPKCIYPTVKFLVIDNSRYVRLTITINDKSTHHIEEMSIRSMALLNKMGMPIGPIVYHTDDLSSEFKHYIDRCRGRESISTEVSRTAKELVSPKILAEIILKIQAADNCPKLNTFTFSAARKLRNYVNNITCGTLRPAQIDYVCKWLTENPAAVLPVKCGDDPQGS